MKRQMTLTLIMFVSMAACRPTAAPAPTPATGAISGQVTDALTGEPIAGANVTTDPPTSSITSGADGSYTFAEIPPGGYTVTASSGADAGASVQVAVDAGRIAAADIHIGPETRAATQTPSLYRLAQAGVTRNAYWRPYTRAKNGVLMALVPKGCFMMGSTDEQLETAMAQCKTTYDTGDCDILASERPAHRVCFEEPFWIDVYEVTQAPYAQFGGDTVGCGCYYPGDNLPQDNVTWFDADAFCQQRGLRLPTEAEWEYAARGPDALIYPWGNEFVPDNVVYAENSGDQPWEVGSKPGGMSWIGAYDLSGNVWEWVADWYSETYYGTLADGVVSPTGPESGEARVLRGGAWNHHPSHMRAALRRAHAPENVYSNVVFRCAGNVSDLP